MKISFDNGTGIRPETGKIENNRQQAAGHGGVGRNTYQVELGRSENRLWEQNPHGNKGKPGKGKNLEELQQEMSRIDTEIQRDYKTVMSNTMSEQDYARLEEEGFRFQNLDPEEAVTIVDRIKVELVRSGQDIAGYTDTVDMDTLTAIVGDQAMAQSIADSFGAVDIPMTKENVQSVLFAREMAESLHMPTDGEYRYMVDNRMEPEIREFYMAQNSGAAGEYGKAPVYYADDVEGYYTKRADKQMWQPAQDEVNRMLAMNGMEATDENREAASWLLEKELPLTEDNLAHYKEITGVSFPLTDSQVVEAAASAIAEGREAAAGNLAEQETIYEKAARLLAYYFDSERAEPENLSARRQLEEVRLRMTAEVNVKLLRSGFSIDTQPMEEFIDALKKAEGEVANQYFPGEEAAVEKYRQYRSTCDTVQDIPALPAALLGKWSQESPEDSLLTFHREGKILQDTYKKAGESYEALMSTPRADLGDSIKKAFSNVDDILTDLGWECTEENRKAARILAYNQMEMTAENLTSVKEAQGQVERIVEQMTPAATLKMIRDGMNPLELSLEELNQYFAELPEEFAETAERYSKFLYSLEQKNEITKEERSAYIGVYRLLHQIEKGDGAAVGALINSQADLNFRNLLTAVRSSKHRNMDVKISDDFGLLSELTEKGVSISSQIEQGYGENWQKVLTQVSEEADARNYYKQEIEQIRQAAQVGQESVAMLERGEVPCNAGNLIASAGLHTLSGSPFRRFMEKAAMKNMETAENSGIGGKDDGRTEDAPEVNAVTTASELEHIWERLEKNEDFQGEYGKLLEHMGEVVEQTALWNADSSLDVKELQLLHKQLHIMGSLSRQEEYHLPMYIGEELTTVHLTIRQEREQRGRVDISLSLPTESDSEAKEPAHIEGSFYLREGRLSGYFAGNTREAVTKLEEAADIFHTNVKEEWQVADIQVLHGTPREDMRNTAPGMDGEGAGSQELYRIAGLFLQAVKTV